MYGRVCVSLCLCRCLCLCACLPVCRCGISTHHAPRTQPAVCTHRIIRRARAIGACPSLRSAHRANPRLGRCSCTAVGSGARGARGGRGRRGGRWCRNKGRMMYQKTKAKSVLERVGARGGGKRLRSECGARLHCCVVKGGQRALWDYRATAKELSIS